MNAVTKGLQVGEVLAGRYQLIQEIGRGGFGVVYRAKQLGMDRDVAVKLLHTAGTANNEMRERFRREAMMARNLNHPHTIRQYDFGETDDGMMYLVLEFLEGRNLVDTLKEEGPLDDSRVRRMAEGVLKSLSEAHAQGIVHRDLKPANIMLCNVYGEKDYVKVLDFGIAKTVMGDTDLTQAGVALGSPRYMAPELLKGLNPTPAVDVYAIAITFAEALMAAPLIATENSVDAARMQLVDDPLPAPDHLKQSTLWPWLSIALKKELEKRYKNAEEMLEYLNASADKLAARGADIEANANAKTTEVRQMQRPGPAAAAAPVVAAAGANPDESMIVGDVDEEDAELPTMRVDANDIDSFLANNNYGAPADAATTEAPVQSRPTASVDQSVAPSTHQTQMAEVVPRPLAPQGDFEQTRPSQDTLNRAALGQPDASGISSPGGSGLNQPSLQIGTGSDLESTEKNPPIAAGSPGEEATQMVSIEQAVAMSPDVSGDAATQMVSIEQAQASLGARPAVAGAPQISGQAFSQAPGIKDSATAFMPTANRPVNEEAEKTKKKYLVVLAGLFVVVIVLIGVIAIAMHSLSKSDPTEVPDQPSVNIPTPVLPPPSAATVRFEIRTNPSNAAIVVEGTEKGRTPAEFSMPEDQLPMAVKLVLEGYESRDIELKKGDVTKFDLTLAPKPVVPENKEPVKVEEPKPKSNKPRKPRKPRKPKEQPKPDKPVIDVWD